MHITPLTDRYYENIKELEEFCGEFALIKYRILVESEYLIALSDFGIMRTLSDEERNFLGGLCNSSDLDIVKRIEREGINGKSPTYHDVRAVEEFIREKMNNSPLKDCTQWIHFALTSDDTNNLAYGLIHTNLINSVIFSCLNNLCDKIYELADRWKYSVILARTHGQVASPTTFGKEFFVFYERLRKEMEHLKSLEYDVKLNGAVGNYNAHYLAFPDKDWVSFSRNFVNKLSSKIDIRLSFNSVTTQIEPHDSFVRICDSLRRINNSLVDFSQDIWGYISDGWLGQKQGDVKGFSYIGSSSTMPHKLNPTDFKNAEGNLILANSLFEGFSRKLQISRFQRDLSDSTVFRNSILPFGFSLNAYKALLKGLSKIDINAKKIDQVIDENPEVIAEGIQTMLRVLGYAQAYDLLKDFVRGKRVSLDELKGFISSLDIPQDVKNRLLDLNPRNYIGIADKLIL